MYTIGRFYLQINWTSAYIKYYTHVFSCTYMNSFKWFFFSCAVYPRDSVYGRRRRRDIDSTLSNILKRFCSDFPNSYNGTAAAAAARLTRCIKSASRRPQHRRPYTVHEKKKKRKNEMNRVVRILVRQTDTLYSGRAIIIIMYLFIIFRRGGRNDRRSRYNM